MKKMKIAVLCLVIHISAFAQVPEWNWAKTATGLGRDEASCIVTDAGGNVYVTGLFRGPTLKFGNTATLTNAGGTSGHDDIFFAKYTPQGELTWVKRFGGNRSDYGGRMVIDGAGHLFMVGYYQSPTLILGTDTLHNQGEFNGFLAKFDLDGNPLMAKSFGGTGSDALTGISSDGQGNLVITGSFNGPSLTLGANTLFNSGPADTYDSFVARLDANVNPLWAMQMGGNKDENVMNGLIDPAGNIVVGGAFASDTLRMGSLQFINADHFPGSYSNDVFMAKYTPDGNLVWARSAGGSFFDDPGNIAVDDGGNSIMAGSFYNTIQFGPYTLVNPDSTLGADVFIVKYDPEGNVAWAKSAGSDDHVTCTNIGLDANRNLYVTGEFISFFLTFGSTTLANSTTLSFANKSDLYVAKYDSSGNALWGKSAGGTGHDLPWGLAVAANGDVHVGGGSFSSPLHFGSTALPHTGSEYPDYFLAKLGNGPLQNLSTEKDALLNAYPNPFGPKFTLQLGEGWSNVTLQILDRMGREVYRQDVAAATRTVEINRNDFTNGVASGIYFIHFQDGMNKRSGFKIVAE